MDVLQRQARFLRRVYARQGVVVIEEPITPALADRVTQQLEFLHQRRWEQITLALSSSGGDQYAAARIHERMAHLQTLGTAIITVGFGTNASGASDLLLCGTRAYLNATASVTLHTSTMGDDFQAVHLLDSWYYLIAHPELASRAHTMPGAAAHLLADPNLPIPQSARAVLLRELHTMHAVCQARRTDPATLWPLYRADAELAPEALLTMRLIDGVIAQATADERAALPRRQKQSARPLFVLRRRDGKSKRCPEGLLDFCHPQPAIKDLPSSLAE